MLPLRAARFAALLAAFALTPICSRAQQVFGSVVGTVTDSSGSAVRNAKVTVAEVNKNIRFDVETNESGNYSKGQLIPGVYIITVESPSFRKAVSDSVPVQVDRAARLDVILTVGDIAQSVEVSAAAPLLQTDRADVANELTGRQILQLPNLGRNFVSFMFLSPGVQLIGAANPVAETPQASFRMSVNGQNFGGTGYQLDGTDNKDPLLGAAIINPNLDAVGESKFATEDFDAEFGYVSAGIFTMSTRSGSNGLHGSAFNYLQNNTSGFSTFGRNPFSEPNGPPAFHSNQFGGSVGGRVIRDRLFFFGDAELVRRRQSAQLLTTVPTDAARLGNFSGYVNNGNNLIYDPATGDPVTGIGRQQYRNNTIPTSQLSPQALSLLNYFPLANTQVGSIPYRNNYIASGNTVFDSEQWDTRWDYYASAKTTAFGRYTLGNYYDLTPGAFGLVNGGPGLDPSGFSGQSSVRNQSLALGLSSSFTPTVNNELRFGYLRYRVDVTPNGYGTQPAKDANIPGLNLDNTYTSGLPFFAINGDGGSNLGYSLTNNRCNCPLTEREQQFQIVDNLSITRGNHNLKFGFDGRYATNLRVPSDKHRSGELSFDGGYTGLVNSRGTVAQGLGLATFLLGDVTQFTRYVSTSTDAQEHQKRVSWYGQDAWRITPRLTVNYGLRWEWVFPETVNAAGNGGMLDLSTGNIAVFGLGQFSDHGFQRMRWTNFAPRLALAYQITPRLVARGGYGWSYGLGIFGSNFGHVVTQNLPVLSTQAISPANAFSNIFTLSQGPPAATFAQPDANGLIPLPNNVAAKVRPAQLTLPLVMAYNGTLQYQLTRSLAVTASYVGNQGRHTLNANGNTIDINQAAWVPGVANLNVRKPYFARYGWTQQISYYCDCANTRYDAFQAKVETRNLAGYTLSGSYAYQVAQADSANSYTFQYNRPLGYGNVEMISRQQIILAQSFDIPVGHGRRFGSHLNRATDLLIGGWNLAGITNFASGRPFTATIGSYPTVVNGQAYTHPDVGPAYPDRGTGNPYPATQDRNSWISGGLGSAFLLPAANSFGNFGFNNLYGPIYVQQDIALSKTITAREQYRFTIRADAYNAFNHTNLGMPNANITDAAAGQITSTAYMSQMRRLQFALRLDF